MAPCIVSDSTGYSLAAVEASLRAGSDIIYFPLESIAHQIREVGVEHCVVSSDFGQVENGPPIQAFAKYLDLLDFEETELRMLIADNPSRLLSR